MAPTDSPHSASNKEQSLPPGVKTLLQGFSSKPPPQVSDKKAESEYSPDLWFHQEKNFMLKLALIISLVATGSIKAQENPYHSLVYSPERKLPFVFPKKKLPTLKYLKIDGKSEVSNLTPLSVPVERFEVSQGDQLILDMKPSSNEHKIRWVLNGRRICRSQSCNIRTSQLAPGKYKIFLQVSGGGSFLGYATEIRVTASKWSQVSKTVTIPQSLSRKPIEGSLGESQELLAYSKDGVAYVEENNRRISTTLDRRFTVPSQRTIRTSVGSRTMIYFPKQFQIYVFGTAKLKNEGSKIQLLEGNFRFTSSPDHSNWLLTLPRSITIGSGNGMDSIIKVGENSINITPLRGEAIVTLPKVLIETLPKHYREMLNDQVLPSPSDKFATILIHPSQSLWIENKHITVSSNGRIKTIKVLKETSPHWLKSSGKQPPSNFSTPLEFQKPRSLISLINSKTNEDQAAAFLQLGLLRRSRLYFERIERQDKTQTNSSQRIIETTMIREKWKDSLELIEKFYDSDKENEFISYYHGVILFKLEKTFAAKQQFKKTLWTAKDTEVIKSSQEFIEYIERDKESGFQGEILFVNNNNPLRLADDQETPTPLNHRASLGVEYDLSYVYNMVEDESFAIGLEALMTGDQWIKEGLSELGYVHINFGLKAQVSLENYRIQVKPYLARTNIGSFAGLDHFGIRIETKLLTWDSKPTITYSHSKNLDPAANDESFIDPMTRRFAPSEDRSRQLQTATMIGTSGNLTWGLKLERIDFRAEGSNDEDGLGFGGLVKYPVSFGLNWGAKLGGAFESYNLEGRSDQGLYLNSEGFYRWTPALTILGVASMEQNSSGDSTQQYSQMSFGIGLRAEL